MREPILKACQALHRDDEERAPIRRALTPQERKDNFTAKFVGGLCAFLGVAFIAYVPTLIEERAAPVVVEELAPEPYVPVAPLTVCGLRSHYSAESPSLNLIVWQVRRCADYYGVPTGLLLAVVEVESGFDIHARGAHGEVGLMQLKERTAAQLGVNPHSWPENIEGGARYLAGCKMKGGGKGTWRSALECYNSGSERRAYAEKILRAWERGSRERGME